jgi:hypothetical protein
MPRRERSLLRSITLALAAACAFAVAQPAAAVQIVGRPILIGAAEDGPKQVDPVAAEAKIGLARLAGMNAIRVTAIWSPGMEELRGGELEMLRNAATAAELQGVRVFVSVYHYGARTTPLTAQARAEFAAFAASIPRQIPSLRDFIIGNEPNLNRFWMPQFTRTGGDAAAPAYLALLATTYDALKAVDPTINVIGGSLSPRGSDKPNTIRPTHSPTAFIRDLGLAYRKSGRTEPIMDWFAFHPYLESSTTPPTLAHPRSTTIAIADYGKLTALLGRAFDGTAQRGSSLPIIYDEFGYEAIVPASKASAYTGREPRTIKPISEATQAAYYRTAIQMAVCQRNVQGILFFHVSDEIDLDRWQSGLLYADDSPKSSLAAVKAAAEAATAGAPHTCQ